MSGKMKTVITVVITAVVSVCATNLVNGVLRFTSAGAKDDLKNKADIINMYLDNTYLYDYDKKKMTDEALTAYVDALDEPYTHYYPADEFSTYIQSTEESYIGIGVVVGINDNNEIEVVAPFEDSAAYEAGVLPGDILKAVEGVRYTGEQMSEAIDKIKSGKKGTSVTITFERDGKEFDLTIERREISSDSVVSEMLDDNIGYIRISAFNIQDSEGTKSTYSEFAEEVKKLQDEGMERMIIDLRDNPGGVLTEVQSIADMLVGEGAIMYVESKNGERETLHSDKNELNIPMAVLINENSASASEVLTGALKDYDKAVIVGKKSYGKGIVQTIFPLPGGSGLSMTTARYFTPSGVCIHDIGIEPDIDVDAPEEYADTYAALIPHDDDTQLQKAIEAVKNR